MKFKEIENSYKNILKNSSLKNSDQVNILVKELEREFIMPLMEKNPLINLKKTKEWKLYVEIFNLQKSYKNKIEN